MALKTIEPEILQQICEALGVKSFSRPYAILIDRGDLGTVFTYLPLFKNEYSALPLQLQKHVYCIDKGRYGLIGFVPKNFEPPDGGALTSVSTVYNDMGTLLELTYTTSEHEKPYVLENAHRRDKLLEFAKKKKIPLKTVLRSRI